MFSNLHPFPNALHSYQVHKILLALGGFCKKPHAPEPKKKKPSIGITLVQTDVSVFQLLSALNSLAHSKVVPFGPAP